VCHSAASSQVPTAHTLAPLAVCPIATGLQSSFARQVAGADCRWFRRARPALRATQHVQSGASRPAHGFECGRLDVRVRRCKVFDCPATSQRLSKRSQGPQSPDTETCSERMTACRRRRLHHCSPGNQTEVFVICSAASETMTTATLLRGLLPRWRVAICPLGVRSASRRSHLSCSTRRVDTAALCSPVRSAPRSRGLRRLVLIFPRAAGP
jgi:hypothetical protein